MTMQAGVCVTHGLITLKDGVDERDFEKRRLQRVWCNSRRQGSLWQSRDMGSVEGHGLRPIPVL